MKLAIEIAGKMMMGESVSRNYNHNRYNYFGFMK